MAASAIYYGEGFSIASEILKLGVAGGLVEKSGSWYSYNDTRIAQGEAAAITYLKDNPSIIAELREKIASLGGESFAEVGAEPELMDA